MSGAALVMGLGLTTLVFVNFDTGQAERTALHFDRLAERLTAEFERRLNLPLYGLKGVRGVYATSKSVERLEFRSYVEPRSLAREFPGTLGFGFIQRVARDDLAAFVAAERADHAPDFAVSTASTARDLYIVKLIEPLEGNRAVVGFDVGSDPVRRSAVERAVRTGEPTTPAAPNSTTRANPRGSSTSPPSTATARRPTLLPSARPP
jgi:CHASE1-domain containing sensor protein